MLLELSARCGGVAGGVTSLSRLWRSGFGWSAESSRGARGRLLASGVPRLVSLQVAEEDVGRLGRSHGEVNVLRLRDGGVSGPASRVADVVKGDLDGVSGGRCSVSEDVGRPAKTFRRDVPCGLKGRF